MFIINFSLNMFRASLCPSSGEQRPCVTAYGVLVLLDVVGSGCEALRCRMWTLLVSYNAAPHNIYIKIIYKYNLHIKPVLESLDCHVHRSHEPQCVHYPQAHFDGFTCVTVQCKKMENILKILTLMADVQEPGTGPHNHPVQFIRRPRALSPYRPL